MWALLSGQQDLRSEQVRWTAVQRAFRARGAPRGQESEGGGLSTTRSPGQAGRAQRRHTEAVCALGLRWLAGVRSPGGCLEAPSLAFRRVWSAGLQTLASSALASSAGLRSGP